MATVIFFASYFFESFNSSLIFILEIRNVNTWGMGRESDFALRLFTNYVANYLCNRQLLYVFYVHVSVTGMDVGLRECKQYDRQALGLELNGGMQ